MHTTLGLCPMPAHPMPNHHAPHTSSSPEQLHCVVLKTLRPSDAGRVATLLLAALLITGGQLLVASVVSAEPAETVADQTTSDLSGTPAAVPVSASRLESYVGSTLNQEERERMFALVGQKADELERNNLLKTVVKLVAPTVVHIEAQKYPTDARGYGRSQSVEETGSGAIIQWKEKFYVLTNRHVVKDAKLSDIVIRCADGRSFNPTQLWSDRETDVAVMALGGADLVAARIGNSDRTEIGDFVLAVGSPFGLSHSVTYGIISAKGRRDLELADGGVRYQDFMQTDASINPGNSGGPLINLRGEIIGINTAIATNSGRNEGVGFSIPINMAISIARQLIDHGTVHRAYLGVTLEAKFSTTQAVELGLPRRMGALINRVAPKSPAEVANLQQGDVIVMFNGTAVDDDNHLVNIISGFTQANSEVPIILYRDGKPLELQIKVGSSASRENN